MLSITKILDSLLDDNLDDFIKLTGGLDLSGVFDVSSNNSFKYPEELNCDPSYLMVASYFGAEKIANYLLETVGSINHFGKNSYPYTITHFSCAGGNLNIIRKLYNLGVDFSINTYSFGSFASREKCEPLYWAFQFDHIDVIKYLTLHGVSIKAIQLRPIFQNGYLHMMELIDNRILSREFFAEYLLTASEYGQSNILDHILGNLEIYDPCQSVFRRKSIFSLLLDRAIYSGSLDSVKSLHHFYSQVLSQEKMNLLFRNELWNSAETLFFDIVDYLIKIHINDFDILENNLITSAIQCDNTPLMSHVLNSHQSIREKLNDKFFRHLLVGIPFLSFEMFKLFPSNMNKEPIDFSYEIIKNVIDSNNLELLKEIRTYGISFETITNKDMNKSNSFEFLEFLDLNGANFEFSPDNESVISVLSHGTTCNVEWISSHCKLSNEHVKRSQCLHHDSNLKKPKFVHFIFDNVDDLDLSCNPYILEKMILHPNSLYSFDDIVKTLDKKAPISDKIINFLLRCQNQNYVRAMVRMISKRNSSFPIHLFSFLFST
ncbi:hypothetical protein TRFO_17048 [Tritrichomonas foetus]|uniref:Uncharacterized protein n=1 Tax=Tritrichomonas foetus TaxID=1144522 RepID=A0A1J4KTU2_9EUKA|nr:hypothetical protein TRFO_17048 [Tritrichomonas foetus]|eukprot:OHT12901.1 hypothetical protein TRFO_17048 [Tritrichomonas foetus]